MKFSCLTWNTAKRVKYAYDQTKLIEEFNPDIVALQEIVLSSEKKFKKLLSKNYKHIVSSFELTPDLSLLIRKRMFGQIIASNFPFKPEDPNNFDVPWKERVLSTKININAVGDASTVSLRPERVEINSSDSSFENSFEAKVKELIYLGDHIRSRVEVCGNDQFIVKVPNSYKGANLKEGASVKLSWKASDSRALDLR